MSGWHATKTPVAAPNLQFASDPWSATIQSWTSWWMLALLPESGGLPLVRPRREGVPVQLLPSLAVALLCLDAISAGTIPAQHAPLRRAERPVILLTRLNRMFDEKKITAADVLFDLKVLCAVSIFDTHLELVFRALFLLDWNLDDVAAAAVAEASKLDVLLCHHLCRTLGNKKHFWDTLILQLYVFSKLYSLVSKIKQKPCLVDFDPTLTLAVETLLSVWPVKFF